MAAKQLKYDQEARQSILVGMGVHSGFADLIVLCAGRVLFLELKSLKGRLSPAQEAFRDAVLAHKADVGLGFDGDGDRCGVVDNTGEEIFADKIGVMLARDLSKIHAKAQFVVDVKSTGLFVTDPELAASGATTTYWKTGHPR